MTPPSSAAPPGGDLERALLTAPLPHPRVDWKAAWRAARMVDAGLDPDAWDARIKASKEREPPCPRWLVQHNSPNRAQRRAKR